MNLLGPVRSALTRFVVVQLRPQGDDLLRLRLGYVAQGFDARFELSDARFNLGEVRSGG
jgi:hypothetical protein